MKTKYVHRTIVFLRMESNNNAKVSLTWAPEDKRKRGRPRTTKSPSQPLFGLVTQRSLGALRDEPKQRLRRRLRTTWHRTVEDKRRRLGFGSWVELEGQEGSCMVEGIDTRPEEQKK